MVGEYFRTSSPGNQIWLKIAGYLEPNNGRELWEADLSIVATADRGVGADGGLAVRSDLLRPDGLGHSRIPHNHLFRHGCNALNFQLQSYQFCSQDQSLVFIPAESVAFVIHAEKLDSLPLRPDSEAVHYLPEVPVSTLKFLGNCFHRHYVVVVYRERLQILNSKTRELKTEQFGDFSIFQFCCQQGQLTISLRNQAGSQCLERTFKLEARDGD